MTTQEQLTATDAAHLLQQQDVLQTEAHQLVTELAIIPLLSAVGPVIQLGSSVLGLMVWRDIDFNVSCSGKQSLAVLQAMQPLLAHPYIQQVHYLNESGSYNDSGQASNDRYFFMLLCTYHEANWKIDISFWLSNAPRREAEQTAALIQQLTPETRLAILWLKDIWHRLPSYRDQVLSIDIYDAVLQHGVRTPDEFDTYLSERGKPTSATIDVDKKRKHEFLSQQHI